MLRASLLRRRACDSPEHGSHARQLSCSTAPPLFRLQRLLKECEERAEAARRPTAQPPAPPQPSTQQRRAVGGANGAAASPPSSEEGDSDASAAAAAGNGAAASDGTPAGGSADQSSDEGGEGSNGAANGADGFVPNLDKLKKLGKRAGPGGKVVRHQADRAEEPKKKAAAAKKGKQARVWGDIAAGGRKGEPARPPPRCCLSAACCPARAWSGSQAVLRAAQLLLKLSFPPQPCLGPRYRPPHLLTWRHPCLALSICRGGPTGLY
jgi:hypothetical protein